MFLMPQVQLSNPLQVRQSQQGLEGWERDAAALKEAVDELARLKKEQEAEREELSAARRREGALKVRIRKISLCWDLFSRSFLVFRGFGIILKSGYAQEEWEGEREVSEVFRWRKGVLKVIIVCAIAFPRLVLSLVIMVFESELCPLKKEREVEGEELETAWQSKRALKAIAVTFFRV
jgi:hypothetical protein